MKYYGAGKMYYNAFTVLRCSTCRWEVHLEAHHDHNGRHRRGHFKAPPGALRCPKCKSPDWRYAKTITLLSRDVAAYVGPGAHPPGHGPRSVRERRARAARKRQRALP